MLSGGGGGGEQKFSKKGMSYVATIWLDFLSLAGFFHCAHCLSMIGCSMFMCISCVYVHKCAYRADRIDIFL